MLVDCDHIMHQKVEIGMIDYLLIGMIDDYDESSGWMFLLVPAHPSFPGQIPQSRKTVVCVCVCTVWNNSVETSLALWPAVFYVHPS